jgi:hypothetical protein
MNMPKFTAEASLNRTKGQYRTGSRVIHSSTRTIAPIYPTLIGHETIPVESCRPGYTMWDDGKCYKILTEPPVGGGSGLPGMPGEVSEGPHGPGGGGVGGGPMTPPKKPARPTKKSPSTKTEFKPRAGQACHVIRFFAPPKWRAVRKDGVYKGPYSGGDWICEDSDPGHEPGTDIRCGTTWAEEGEFYTDGCYNGSI